MVEHLEPALARIRAHRCDFPSMGSASFRQPHTLHTLHNVAVYNHEVGYDTLDGVRLIVLTGVVISLETLGTVQRRVQEGGHLRLASASGTSRFRNGEDQGNYYRAGWQRQMVSRE